MVTLDVPLKRDTTNDSENEKTYMEILFHNFITRPSCYGNSGEAKQTSLQAQHPPLNFHITKIPHHSTNQPSLAAREKDACICMDMMS